MTAKKTSQRWFLSIWWRRYYHTWICPIFEVLSFGV